MIERSFWAEPLWVLALEPRRQFFVKPLGVCPRRTAEQVVDVRKYLDISLTMVESTRFIRTLLESLGNQPRVQRSLPTNSGAPRTVEYPILSEEPVFPRNWVLHLEVPGWAAGREKVRLEVGICNVDTLKMVQSILKVSDEILCTSINQRACRMYTIYSSSFQKYI